MNINRRVRITAGVARSRTCHRGTRFCGTAGNMHLFSARLLLIPPMSEVFCAMRGNTGSLPTVPHNPGTAVVFPTRRAGRANNHYSGGYKTRPLG